MPISLTQGPDKALTQRYGDSTHAISVKNHHAFL